MNNDILILSLTAASIGLIHTLIGPDHYLPFIMMSKAGKWSEKKTIWVTILCGIGHVLSSVVIGIIGIAAGIGLGSLELIEGTRGEIAAWVLISFGFLYMIWGIRKAYTNRPHSHLHMGSDGTYSTHAHDHQGEHVHVERKKKSLTPWVLFVIFVLGPCEPLIPLLMFPAAEQSVLGLITVTSAFGIVTIGTMVSVVAVSLWGLNLLPIGKLERYSHAFAGFAICASGLAINLLEL
jgi:nickel/cobalt transporter (NicO) family protein